MISFILWFMAGYIAYVLVDNKRQKRYMDSKKTYKLLAMLILSGWFGLGFVVGKYYT